MKLIWTPEAEKDRLDVLDYIAVDDPAAALRMNRVFQLAAERAATFPMAARAGDVPGTRELIPHPHYRLVYQIKGEAVWILGIIHTARQWPPAGDGTS
ncbi:type II toxin-antitoxin system RelE/ParE family toxin [Aquibium oceanicum]|uniref:Addiction module toxin RelE n=1 Tax=Aquibium oceanicum TaxID=1670800 RepID=A0A1L3STA8_9HYPH|nr:type II toxin-antitoxin system RelE/ParE family toxin [Aquibium oceanicum]APH72542.1 addiction module toxin RelE [Aquibium oceanicum]